MSKARVLAVSMSLRGTQRKRSTGRAGMNPLCKPQDGRKMTQGTAAPGALLAKPHTDTTGKLINRTPRTLGALPGERHPAAASVMATPASLGSFFLPPSPSRQAWLSHPALVRDRKRRLEPHQCCCCHMQGKPRSRPTFQKTNKTNTVFAQRDLKKYGHWGWSSCIAG